MKRNVLQRKEFKKKTFLNNFYSERNFQKEKEEKFLRSK